MAGTMAAVAIVACAAVLTVGLVAGSAAAVVSQRAAGAADAAALAAADAASGAVAGIPCDLAQRVAAASGASLIGCALDGLTATVTVSAPFAALNAMASARAGPPG